MGSYLDRLDQENALPKIVIYNLNPADNYVMATMIGNFQDGVTAGKIQFGSGWWFLDQKEAMQWQMNALSNCGLISRFLGMLTDSRSFMSYPRHEYFRRVLVRHVRAGHGERRDTGQRRTGGASGAGHLLRECAPLPGIERGVGLGTISGRERKWRCRRRRVVAEMAALPAVSEVLASLHRACIPPERWMKIAIPTRATKAVSRQYSARSCPRSSVCKALSKCRNIATTKPKISVKRRREHGP